MSETMSAAVRFENRPGATAPGAFRSPERSTPAEPSIPTPSHEPQLEQRDRARLCELVEQMRRSVVEATVVRERPRKVELWESYRTARAEAIALLGCRPDTPSAGRPRRA
jgi:hypothetical protein